MNRHRPTYVYTVVLDGYDELPTVVDPDPRLDFVAFVAGGVAHRPPWSIVPVDHIFLDRKITSGYFKTNPELLFGADAIVVWLDACLDNVRIDSETVASWLNDSPIAAPPHLYRQTIAAEKDELMRDFLEDAIGANRLWHRIQESGFRDDQGLSATLLLARDLRHPQVRTANRLWWDAILNGARRDQLSFNYAVWAAGLTCHAIDVDWLRPNTVFSRLEHKDPKGRTFDRQAWDINATEFSVWRGLELPPLPPNCPIAPLFHPEFWSDYALESIRLLNQAVVNSNEILEGNYCYFHQSPVHRRRPPDPRRSWKREVLRRAVLAGRTALEIGFNAGHSAVIILDANPCLELTSIDIGQHNYSRACAEIVEARYPGRFRILWGPSRDVLGSLGNDWSPFEIVHVDGGHDEEAVLVDFDWLQHRCRPGTTVIVDDAYIPWIKNLLEKAQLDGCLQEAKMSIPTSAENRVFVTTAPSPEESPHEPEESEGNAAIEDLREASRLEPFTAENEALRREAHFSAATRTLLNREVDKLWNSWSWRLFRPLRNLVRAIRGFDKETEPIPQSALEALRIVIAIRQSLSWELTSPLRLVGRGLFQMGLIGSGPRGQEDSRIDSERSGVDKQ